MNVLDENVVESQRQLLRSWRIPVRQIGVAIGWQGLKDTVDSTTVPIVKRLRSLPP